MRDLCPWRWSCLCFIHWWVYQKRAPSLSCLCLPYSACLECTDVSFWEWASCSFNTYTSVLHSHVLNAPPVIQRLTSLLMSCLVFLIAVCCLYFKSVGLGSVVEALSCPPPFFFFHSCFYFIFGPPHCSCNSGTFCFLTTQQTILKVWLRYMLSHGAYISFVWFYLANILGCTKPCL